MAFDETDWSDEDPDDDAFDTGMLDAPPTDFTSDAGAEEGLADLWTGGSPSDAEAGDNDADFATGSLDGPPEDLTSESPIEAPEEKPGPPPLVFGSSDEWLREWLLRSWQPHVPPQASIANEAPEDPTTGYHWCPRWWLHPEAVARIEALWRAWEQLRTDPMMGMTVWWRDHFDHHWPRLVASGGAFQYCTPAVHRDAPTWSAIASPAAVTDHSPDS